jgi:apolipoprotein N-acyltransferase
MRRLLPIAAAVVSGALTSLALPLVISAVSLRPLDPRGHLEVVAWFSLVPAFLALRGARRPALLGLLTGVVYFFCAIYWVGHAMTEFGRLPLALAGLALTLLVLYAAAHWAIAFGVAARLHARLGWPLWAVLPPVWAATELLRNYLFSGFPWANLGYTQVRTLPIAQLAALAGPYGIAALVVLVNAVLAETVVALRARARPPVSALAIAAAALVLTLGYGWAHLAAVRREMAAAPAVPVGIVQPNIEQGRTNSKRENARYILDRLLEPTLAADRAGAELVVWPEAVYPVSYVPPDLASFDVPGAGIPRLARAHLLAGVSTAERIPGADGRPSWRIGNRLFLVTPALDVTGRYQKLHLVPFGEYVPDVVQAVLPFLKQVVPMPAEASPGDDYAVLTFPRPPRTPGGDAPARAAAASPPGAADPAAAQRSTEAGAGQVRIAPLICFDAIFPEIVRTFGRKEPPPDLLVNSTNDAWYGYSSGPYQFLAIVQLRAIEARRAVARSAVAGVSALILPTGELAPGALDVGPVDPELAPDRDEPARLLLADAPLLRGQTVYARAGDLFAWASALFAAGALAFTWARRARPHPSRT